MRIVPYNRTIVVIGDTFPHRKIFKGRGGRWFRKYQGWMFRDERRDEISGIVRDLDPAAIID